ncbi:hypothetical protein GALMADRAFT_223835 [Galerina marginata CBS 339.88]|uniref:non-specific serine/threonine protein kinase n=1 Tax=Galerina marginata (strain CBS 339.88) TaxID=685588 RepID=A0A067TF84_GALM3|nr:hypothetical protein GALMADRAFT_223835 [Galerina marginata CBS 339.88]
MQLSGLSNQAPNPTFSFDSPSQPQELLTVLQVNPVCLSWAVYSNLSFCPNRVYNPTPAIQGNSKIDPVSTSVPFAWYASVTSLGFSQRFFLHGVKERFERTVAGSTNGLLGRIGVRLVTDDERKDSSKTANNFFTTVLVLGSIWTILYFAFRILVLNPLRKFALPIINCFITIYSFVVSFIWNPKMSIKDAFHFTFNVVVRLGRGTLAALQCAGKVYGTYMADSSPDADIQLLLHIGSLLLYGCQWLWKTVGSIFRRGPGSAAEQSGPPLGVTMASQITSESMAATAVASSVESANSEATLLLAELVMRLPSQTPPVKRPNRNSTPRAANYDIPPSTGLPTPVRRPTRRPVVHVSGQEVPSPNQVDVPSRRPVVHVSGQAVPSPNQVDVPTRRTRRKSIVQPAKIVVRSSTPSQAPDSIKHTEHMPIVKLILGTIDNVTPSSTHIPSTTINRPTAKPAENPSQSPVQAAAVAVIRTLDHRTLFVPTDDLVPQAIVERNERKPVVKSAIKPFHNVVSPFTPVTPPIKRTDSEPSEKPTEIAAQSPELAAAIALIRTLDSKTLFAPAVDATQSSTPTFKCSEPQHPFHSLSNISRAPRISSDKYEDGSMVHVIPLPSGVADQSLLVFKASKTRDVLGLGIIAQIRALRRSVGPERWKSIIDGLSFIGQLNLLDAFYPRGHLSRYMRTLGGCLDRRLAKVYLVEMVSAILAIHDIGIVHARISPLTLVLKDDGHLILSNVALSALVDLRLMDGDTRKPVFLLAAQDPNELSDKERKLVRQALSDFYGMGVVYYRMITGRAPPFLPSVEDKNLDLQPDHLQPLTKQDQSFLSLLFDNCRHKRYSVKDLKDHPIFDDIDWDVDRQTIFVPPPRSVVIKKPRRPAISES